MYLKLKDQIKKSMIEKNENLSFLRTLKSEIDMLAKNDNNRAVTDSDVFVTVKRFMKNNQETIKTLHDQAKEIPAELLKEEQILQQYMPQMLSKENLTEIIELKIDQYGKDKKAFGLIMKDLNIEYKDTVDKGLASTIIKGLINGDS